MLTDLTQERLKERLSYDKKTGVFRWRVSTGSISAGGLAGCINGAGYNIIQIDGVLYRANRLAFLYVEGYFPENGVDHIDRDTVNNRWDNLREVSHQCNLRNAKLSKSNTSGVKGVYYHNARKKHVACIRVSRKLIYLGSFNDFDEAVCARLAAEQAENWAGCDSHSPAYLHVKNMLN